MREKLQVKKDKIAYNLAVMNLIRLEIEENQESDFFEISKKLKDKDRENNHNSRKVLRRTNWWEEEGPTDDQNVSSESEDFWGDELSCCNFVRLSWPAVRILFFFSWVGDSSALALCTSVDCEPLWLLTYSALENNYEFVVRINK